MAGAGKSLDADELLLAQVDLGLEPELDPVVLHRLGQPDAPPARTDYFDKQVPGLALRITEHGHRSWSVHYTSPRDGKRARVSIGTYPATSLAGARGKAIECRGYLQEDPPRDPRDAITAQAAGAMTVGALVPLYLEKPHRRTGRPRKTVKEIERRLRVNAVPLIGQVKLADFHRRDVTRVLAPIINRKRLAEASSVFENLRGMLRWAVSQGYLDRNPMEGMERPAAPRTRDRVLSEDEIRTLWNGLPKSLARSKICQHIIRLCLTTGQRVGEVAGMTRAELDLKAREWRLPAARTKNGFEHAVPLSDLAIKIIREAITDAGDRAQLFAVAPVSVAGTIFYANESGRFRIAHWTMHDLRRSALTGMARLGVAPIVLAHVANHRSATRAGITLSVYAHYDYGHEKRAALDVWADRLAAVVGGTGADVVLIRGRHA
jgi:integrase